MIKTKDKLQCEVSSNAKRYAKAKAKSLKISLSQYIDLLLSNAMESKGISSVPASVGIPQSQDTHRMIVELYQIVKNNMGKPWYRRIFG